MNQLIELRIPKTNKHLILLVETENLNKINSIINRVNDWFFEYFPIPTNEQYFPKIKAEFMSNDICFKEYLKTIETKELLSFLKSARACGGHYSPWDGDISFSIEELKEELSTREHIPNKNERKLIRQEKAKNKK